MQRFETFENVCHFFIQSKLDKRYIETIDKQLEKTPNKDLVALVKQVKSFHTMRRLLCLKICKHLGNNPILNSLASSQGVIQYKKCPKDGMCALSKTKINEKNGILLILDGNNLITVHSRYKIILYHFYMLVHMPDEIGLEAVKWLKKQKWWQNGQECSTSDCTKKIINYNDHVFAKGLYVKLKSTAEYIEKEMPKIPLQIAL
jgi:hypothetical protein